jgi:hypothetical protein
MLRMNFKTRDIPKPVWKVLWRQLRIVNREHKRAFEDMLIFGTGCLETGPEVPDFIRAVHPANVDVRLMDAR